MKLYRPSRRWKKIDNPYQVFSTEFRDKNGHLISVGDIIEYQRKKKSGWSKACIPAGTFIKAQVDEIIVKVKKDYQGFWILRAISVTARGLNNMPGISGEPYRIYDTSYVTNTSFPSVSDEIDFLVDMDNEEFSVGLI